MYGAIIGDIVGSTYGGWLHNVKRKDFEWLPLGSDCTDDSVMTVAVACALLKSKGDGERFSRMLPGIMRELGREYPYAGYGGRFKKWLKSENEGPYESYGNGSAMRVSPCGLIAKSLSEALDLAKRSAEVTHNHPEGIKGAQAVAECIYMAKIGSSKADIKSMIEEKYYKLGKKINEYRDEKQKDISCQVTVPIAIQAFIEGSDYEDTIRNAISVGGDSDTIAAIAGSIAWSFYKTHNGGLTDDMKKIKDEAMEYMPELFIEVADKFEELF